MSAKAVPPARATTFAGAVSSASGSSSPSTIHTIAPAANPNPTGRTDVKVSTNRNAGTARSGCGRLEKMLHPRGCSDRGAARDEDEADREAFGDVVHRDRDRDQQPKRRSVGERSADPDSFGRGVDRHHADDQQRPPRVLASQRSHPVSMVVLEVALGHQHEADSQRNAHRGAPRAAIDTLQRKAEARREHHTGRDRVRRPEYKPASRSDEEQRQRAKPGRQRRHESSEEHRDDVRLHQGWSA